jgi:hypothetical protein
VTDGLERHESVALVVAAIREATASTTRREGRP